MKTNIVVKMRSNNLTIIMKHGARDRTNDRFRIPQYCSLTILCQLSDWATFIFLRKHGYNTEIENILQKRSTFGDGTWSGLLAVPALADSPATNRFSVCRDAKKSDSNSTDLL